MTTPRRAPLHNGLKLQLTAVPPPAGPPPVTPTIFHHHRKKKEHFVLGHATTHEDHDTHHLLVPQELPPSYPTSPNPSDNECEEQPADQKDDDLVFVANPLLHQVYDPLEHAEFITADELSRFILDSSPDDFLIIDTRTHDFEGGHIPNSITMCEEKFDTYIPHVVARISHMNDNPMVVVTGMHSRVRAPKIALRMKSILLGHAPEIPADVKVLRGGMQGWMARFARDDRLVDSFVHKQWDLRGMEVLSHD